MGSGFRVQGSGYGVRVQGPNTEVQRPVSLRTVPRGHASSAVVVPVSAVVVVPSVVAVVVSLVVVVVVVPASVVAVVVPLVVVSHAPEVPGGHERGAVVSPGGMPPVVFVSLPASPPAF